LAQSNDRAVARLHTVALADNNGVIVDVEATCSPGKPGLHLIGLSDAAIRATSDRVQAAIHNAGLPCPTRMLVVQLLPASLPKRGSAFDLAIALAVLAAAGTAPPPDTRTVVLGELGLDGTVRPVAGILPAVLAAAETGHTHALVPTGNASEARTVSGITIVPINTLNTALSWLRGE
jgi:magnesium chelatase family protein